MIADIVTQQKPKDETLRYIAALLVFVPLVFHRFFIGGYEQSYDDYQGVGLSLVGYLANLLMLILPLITRSRSSGSPMMYFWIILFFVSVAQLFNTYYLFRVDAFGLVATTVRTMLWSAAIVIYCMFYFDIRMLLKAFIHIMTAAAIIALGTYMIYLISGIPLCVNIDRGIGRLQGMFSEPSTLSAVFPGFVLANLYQRDYKRAALGAIVIVLTFSIICLATGAIAVLIFAVHRWPKAISTLAYSATAFLAMVAFSAGSSLGEGAYRFSQYLKSFVDLFWPDGPVRQNTIDRVIDALASVSTYVTSSQIIDIGQSGSLARLVGAVSLTENMQRDGTSWIGYGLSNYGYVTDQLYGTVLDFGFLPYLMSSFGIPLGIIAIFFLLFRILKWRDISMPLFFIFLCSYFGTIYNSAGGITAYTLPVLGLFASYAAHRQIVQARAASKAVQAWPA